MNSREFQKPCNWRITSSGAVLATRTCLIIGEVMLFVENLDIAIGFDLSADLDNPYDMGGVIRKGRNAEDFSSNSVRRPLSSRSG